MFPNTIYLQIHKQFGLSFAYDAPKIWNELPDDVRSATSIASFRKKLKAYILPSLSSLVFSTPYGVLRDVDHCYG